MQFFIITLNKLFKQIKNRQLENKLEKITVKIAVILFVLHTSLIFLSDYIPQLEAFKGYSIIFAVSTPFTVFLFFELFQLILAIPRSIPEAVLKQYEVITIVLVRNIFKELSYIDNFHSLSNQGEILAKVGVDFVFAILCFSMVLIYSKILRRIFGMANINYTNITYNLIKKSLSIVLLFSAIILLLVTLFEGNIFDHSFIDFYFQNIFTLFILVDVLVLVISLSIVQSYEVIFVNAALLISTIIVRFAFTAEFPYNNITPFFGILLGLSTLIIFYLDLKSNYK